MGSGMIETKQPPEASNFQIQVCVSRVNIAITKVVSVSCNVNRDV